jgi:hypothetical protein
MVSCQVRGQILIILENKEAFIMHHSLALSIQSSANKPEES